MDRRQVLQRLRRLEPRLRKQGVEALYLYGSYARDEADKDSDIDILVDFEPQRRDDFPSYIGSYHLLTEQFPDCDIGFGTRQNIVPRYLPEIENAILRVF